MDLVFGVNFGANVITVLTLFFFYSATYWWKLLKFGVLSQIVLVYICTKFCEVLTLSHPISHICSYEFSFMQTQTVHGIKTSFYDITLSSVLGGEIMLINSFPLR